MDIKYTYETHRRLRERLIEAWRTYADNGKLIEADNVLELLRKQDNFMKELKKAEALGLE